MWQALRDVLIESMRKGQLPAMCTALLIALFLYKTPADYYPQLWERFFKSRNLILITSLVLNLLLMFGWYINAKHLRRMFKEETERIINERNDLQSKHGVKVQSSQR
jgi:glucan phosphoethanolaminetransferase (alkaline phosphatase superfamily)